AWHHDLASSSGDYNAEIHAGYPWSLVTEPWRDAYGTDGVHTGAVLNTRIEVAVSDVRAREVESLFGFAKGFVRTVPSGLDMLDCLSISEHGRELVERLNLHAVWPVFLCPVRVTKRKNIE